MANNKQQSTTFKHVIAAATNLWLVMIWKSKAGNIELILFRGIRIPSTPAPAQAERWWVVSPTYSGYNFINFLNSNWTTVTCCVEQKIIILLGFQVSRVSSHMPSSVASLSWELTTCGTRPGGIRQWHTPVAHAIPRFALPSMGASSKPGARRFATT